MRSGTTLVRQSGTNASTVAHCNSWSIALHISGCAETCESTIAMSLSVWTPCPNMTKCSAVCSHAHPNCTDKILYVIFMHLTCTFEFCSQFHSPSDHTTGNTADKHPNLFCMPIVLLIDLESPAMREHVDHMQEGPGWNAHAGATAM